MGLCHFDNLDNACSVKDDIESQFNVFFNLVFKACVMEKKLLKKQFLKS